MKPINLIKLLMVSVSVCFLLFLILQVVYFIVVPDYSIRQPELKDYFLEDRVQVLMSSCKDDFCLENNPFIIRKGTTNELYAVLKNNGDCGITANISMTPINMIDCRVGDSSPEPAVVMASIKKAEVYPGNNSILLFRAFAKSCAPPGTYKFIVNLAYISCGKEMVNREKMVEVIIS